ncbi:hypothetical protein GA0074695_6032 [Micromonospora viridifaciens]|uniref:Uncharacterized protein n=1 Tax=Micromonospora viridifaciens TaxID=1881 RepID=A0A1C4ZS36_MICVI|nr:hypothetical protein [Micromonospora viridifaciens]SCF35775.1 hypothetical protein GA0074695_6032 [Micromonospora viridifaciens]
MNIISQIVPGIRDTRTPFAVGLLWAAFLWLLYFNLPPQSWNETRLQEIAAPLTKLPVELRIAFGIFLVYLLGVCMEMVARAFHVLLLMAGTLALASAVLALLVQPGPAWSAFLMLCLVFLTYTTLETRRLLRKMPDEPFRTVFEDTALQAVTRFLGSVSHAFTSLREKAEPDFGNFQELLKTDLERAFGEDTSILPAAVERLSPAMLSRAAEAVLLKAENLYPFATSAEEKAKLSQATDIALLKFYIRDDANIATLARKALLQELHDSPEARASFATTVFALSGLRSRLRGRMEQAEVALRVNYRELHNEIDRTRSEGDFRKGVALPLAALLTISIITVARALGRAPTVESVGVPIALSLAAAGVVFIAGTQKSKRAHQLLYACLLENIVGVTREKLYGKELFVPLEITRIERPARIRRHARDLLREAALRALTRATEKVRRDHGAPASAGNAQHRDRAGSPVAGHRTVETGEDAAAEQPYEGSLSPTTPPRSAP